MGESVPEVPLPDLEPPRSRLHRFLVQPRSRSTRYATAGGALLVSLALTALFDRLPNATETHAVNLLAATLAAALGGLGPGLLVAVTGAVAVDFFFSEPRGRIFDSIDSGARVVVYAGMAALAAGFVGVLRRAFEDVDRYRAERARRLNLGLLDVIAHDLSSPILALSLHAELVGRAVKAGAPTERLAGTADAMRRAVDQARRILADLRTAVSLDLGMLRVQPVRCSPGAVVADALAVLRPGAAERGVELIDDVPDGIPDACCDRIDQVLANLVGNAVKFSPAGTRVWVRVRAQASELRFEVADEGPGIPEEQVPHLFDRYWKGGEAGAHGSGLGLFIARAIVEANGGRIDVSSAPGRGTTFAFTLPRMKDVP